MLLANSTQTIAGNVRLLDDERRSGALETATHLATCVDVCRAYTFEWVTVVNIRRAFRHWPRPVTDVDIFAVLLLHHVRDPEDSALYDTAKAVWHNITRGDYGDARN